jgi:biopolymer transport protein ExbB
VLAIVIEKFIGMGAMERKANKFIGKAQGILKSSEERKIDKVFALCEMSSSPPARILQAGIRKINKGREEIKEAVIDAGSLEVPYLGRYLRILGTVVTISPLLGLLGTVRGMIRAFNVVALQGVGEPGALAAGISEALYTTAFGLGIAIPALVFYNYFTHRTDRLVRKLESSSGEFIELLIGR